MSSAYFAPLVTRKVIIAAPGVYVTRSGEPVTVEKVSTKHDFGCTGTYADGTRERWHKSGRISAGQETQNDIVRAEGEPDADEANERAALTHEELDRFHRAYIECALWASIDHREEMNGESLEGEELATVTHNDMLNTCRLWTDANAADIREAITTCEGYTIERAGHDLWLTQNHHGAGFWDRGLGEVGERLTQAAHLEGSSDLYLGDDGFVYAT